MNRIPVILVVLVISCLTASTQTRYYRFARLGVDDGLSSYRTYDVVQDSTGFLWIATFEGLNRYDGHSITVFRHKENDSTSLSHNIIRSLLVDRSGTLWAGTADGGLNKFNPTSERFTRYTNDLTNPLSISGGLIGCIYQDRAGTIWIGSRSKGLNKLVMHDSSAGKRNQLTFVHYKHNSLDETSLSANGVYTMLEDSYGTLWVGTENGLNAFDRKTEKFTRYMHQLNNQQSLSSNFVVALLEDRSHNLWIGTDRGGLNKFERSSGRFKRHRHDPQNPHSLGFDDVYALHEDDQGQLWVGTLKGLDMFDRATGVFTHFKNDPIDPSSLANDYIRSIRSDRSGNIWIVTDRGLSKLNKNVRRFIHFRHATHASEPQVVYALLETGGQKTIRSQEPLPYPSLWIGSTEGLKRIDRQTRKAYHFKHSPDDLRSLNSNFVQIVFEDKLHNIWVGTAESGINKYDPASNTFQRFSWESGEQNNTVMSICEDRPGVLWIGTLTGGLLRFNAKAGLFTQFRNDPNDTSSLSNNNVYTILKDSKGNVWLGTEGGGLEQLEFSKPVGTLQGKSFVRFKHHRHHPQDSGSISNDRVYALFESRAGKMWASTGNGLNCYERNSNRFSLKVPSDRLGSSFCLRILEDTEGNLWLSTAQSGIFRYDPSTGRVQNYRAEDGLQGNQFSYAAFMRRNGEMIFGGENGYTVFRPEEIRESPVPPPVVLTSFEIFRKPAELNTAVAAIASLRLKYNQNFFSFEFAVLDFASPSRNQYAYMLDGLDTAWNYALNGRFASYTNVDPGEYVIRLKGSNADGVWNEAGLSIPTTITPPFWATWWFRGMMTVVVIGILTAAYQYRVRKLLEMERMRLRIASDLHDDIGSSLSSIALITDMVRNHLPADQVDRQHLTDASQAARHTADALRDIVWIINPENEQLDDIILRMKDSATKLLVGMEYSFDCQQNGMANVLDMEFRRHALLIYKEILNNIAKHSRATKVTISIGQENSIFHLAIADNGVGFDEATIRRGNGLNNLKARASKIGGTIEVQSSPGKGTNIRLTAKIP